MHCVLQVRWGPGEAGAAARADANDVLNMQLIASAEAKADRRGYANLAVRPAIFGVLRLIIHVYI